MGFNSGFKGLIYTVSVAVICTDKSVIDPFLYIVALERHNEATVVLNIHAVIYDTVT